LSRNVLHLFYTEKQELAMRFGKEGGSVVESARQRFPPPGRRRSGYDHILLPSSLITTGSRSLVESGPRAVPGLM
jgi:hypothetical protein